MKIIGIIIVVLVMLTVFLTGIGFSIRNMIEEYRDNKRKEKIRKSKL